MTQDPVGADLPQEHAEILARLAAATPAERAEIVLLAIEADAHGRLVLPSGGGQPVMLDGVVLGGLALDEVAGREGTPPWWDPEGQRVRLNEADLRGVSLRKADLHGVDLAGADLRGAFLGGADLRAARLDRAQLADADLAGALLEGASLGEADLQGAMLEEANLRAAVLRFSDLRGAVLEDADLRAADLWGAALEGAVMNRADLRGASLEEAKCGGADLSGARLGEAVLRHADLRAARLEGADLRGAVLGGTDLREAVLKDAHLEEAELGTCLLTHAHLSGTRLDGARFERDQLGEAIGEDLAGRFEEARKGYLVLERAFVTLGDPDAASWAYRKRRRMQKHEALRQAQAARAGGRRRDAIRAYARYVGDQTVEWLCDYGESIPRVLASLAVLYLAFTLLYGITGSVVREHDAPGGSVQVLTRNPVDLAIFSLLAMTTGSIGIRLLPRHDLALVLVGAHVFLGVALIGLLGFVLGNRIRR